MKALVLALVLFPVQAWAGTLCPKKLEERTSPCTASPEEKAEIAGFVTDGLAAHKEFEAALAMETQLREEAMALKDADKITDAKSFDKVAASYQKRLSKRLAQEAKRDRKREDRERKEDRGGGTPPPDGNDHFWDPSCGCWVRRY